MKTQLHLEDLSSKLKEIRGISIRAYGISEALINCKISLSYSDAKNLCAKTKSGLIKNKQLRDLFFEILTARLDEVVAKKESKVNNG